MRILDMANTHPAYLVCKSSQFASVMVFCGTLAASANADSMSNKIDVIVPVYNEEECLERFIKITRTQHPQ